MRWGYSSDQCRQIPCPHGAYIPVKIIRIQIHVNLKCKINAVYNIIPCGDSCDKKNNNNKAREGDRVKGFYRIIGTRRNRLEFMFGILSVGYRKLRKKK